MTPKGPLLFDSHTLLKFFQKEAGHEQVAQLLEKAHRLRVKKLLCAINMGEIIYITKRVFGDKKKIEVLAHIERRDSPSFPRRTASSFRPRNTRQSTAFHTQTVSRLRPQ